MSCPYFSNWPPAVQQRLGSVLVLLQMGLLLVLGWLALRAVWPHPAAALATPQAIVLGLASGLLGGWTLLHNRLGNFNIHPAPRIDGVLVTSGPYHWVRHPMYSAVLLGAAALACLPGSAQPWLIWLSLCAVLWAKSWLEEQWLRVHYAPYDAYCQQCGRFLPRLARRSVVATQDERR